MSKWVWLDPFGYLKHKLWAKEGQGVKLSIWLLTTKNQESLWFPCMQVVCHIMLESSWQGYKFSLDLNLIKGLHANLWDSKVARIPILGILGLSRQNDIWVLALWPGTKNIIRGKVVASPKFGPWWVFWIYVYPWLIRAPKMLQLCINQLVVWFVQVRVSN
jgi:hypothetical protein